MSLLLETTLGDIVIDLDVEGSPELCKNVLKLAKARYYTQTLFYNVQPNRFCQLGDPHGDGSGGGCIQGLISTEGSLEKVLQSNQRFLKSNMGRPLTQEECCEKGRVVATEMNGISDTIGSQLLITTSEGQDMSLDGYSSTRAKAGDNLIRQSFRSVGIVREDHADVLGKIASTYCDADGRPYADIRIVRALIVDDPFDDPPGMDRLFKGRDVVFEGDRVTVSPEWERPPEETVEIRIPADQVDPLTAEEDLEKLRQREEEHLKKQDKSRAVVLEMLGDLPSAEIKAPENVLFVCKLNPITEDEDLELIFSRFDENISAEIIRDPETGNSLQYAFIEFTKKDMAVEAYFKMNNALVDDRRIKVDFSQSVSKIWDKYNQRMRSNSGGRSNVGMPTDPYGNNNHRQGNRGAPRIGTFSRNDNLRGGRNDRNFGRNDRKSRQGLYHRSPHQHRGLPSKNDDKGPVELDQRKESRGMHYADNSFDGKRSDASPREERRGSDRRDRKHRKHRKDKKHRRNQSSREDYSERSLSRTRDDDRREHGKKRYSDERRHGDDDRDHKRNRDRQGDEENGLEERRKHRRERSRDRDQYSKNREYQRRHRSRSRSHSRGNSDRRRRDRSHDRKSRDNHRRRSHCSNVYRDEPSHNHNHRKRSRHDSPDRYTFLK